MPWQEQFQEAGWPEVYFSLVWPLSWVGSVMGSGRQSLLLLLVPWGSLRDQRPHSGLCAPGIPAYLL